MKRKDREITEKEDILRIIKNCDVCNVAFFDKDYPYILPLNFGVTFDGEYFTLYFHGAHTGKKFDLLKLNNHVAFDMSCSHKLHLEEVACDSTMEFESVCGNGILEVVEDEYKVDALTAIMKQYSKEDHFEFNEHHVTAVTVLKLTVNEVTGKRLVKR